MIRELSREISRNVAHAAGEWGYSGYPAALKRLWPIRLTDSGVLKCTVGDAPVFTDSPTLSAGGVIPGDGPSFTDVVSWADGGTLVVEFTATTASADLVGDVQVFGPLYACSTGLKAKDGTSEASVATSWASGEVVTGVVVVEDDGKMRIGDGRFIA